MTENKATALAIAVLLCAVLAGCVGATPDTTSVNHHSSWVNHPTFLYDHDNWSLVCDENQKEMMIVRRYDQEPFDVFGGDGGGYGSYMTLEPAKKRAEEISRQVWSSPLDHCP
jgi:hypothetical protein